MPKRLAIVSHAHPSVRSGGAEIAAYALFQGLTRIGEEALFIATVPEDDLDKVELADPEKEIIVPFPISEHDWFYHNSSPQTSHEVIKVINAFSPNYVNFHHFIYLGAQSVVESAAANSWKTFLTLHEYLSLCQSDGQMVTRQEKRLCTRSSPHKCVRCWPEYDRYQFEARSDHMLSMLNSVSGLVSPSEFLKGRFVGAGIAQDQIAVIENGLLNPPQRRETRRERESTEPWVFGYFGQINPYKGVDVLLSAVERLNASSDRNFIVRVHGHLVGQTDELVTKLEAGIAAGVVQYAGAYSNDAVGDLMSRCDYVVVPSLWWENSPVVIQEAFAVGRPLLVSGIGGMAEKVEHDVHGLHFSTNDPVDLARVMAVACDYDLYRRLEANVAQPISAEAMAEKYLELFAMSA